MPSRQFSTVRKALSGPCADTPPHLVFQPLTLVLSKSSSITVPKG